MTVSVAGRLVPRANALSDSARLVLNLIDGGVEWLAWAIWHPRAQYRFDSEEALVAAVQVGLHGWHLMLMPALQLLVGPAKLMTLDHHDLRILAEAKGAGGRAEAVLDRHRLVTQPELASDLVALGELLDGAPLPMLQGMALEDQLDIHALMSGDNDRPDGDRREAALFAAERAVTPREFADYFRAYLRYFPDPCPSGKAGSRRARLGEAMDGLLPHLFEALDCPCADGSAQSWEVADAINEWLAMGRRLGFSRRSQLAEQIVAHTRFAGRDSDEEVGRIVAGYLAGAQALLGSGEIGRRRLGQDGISSTFRIRSEAEQAVITLGRQGVIALSEFRPSREEPVERPESRRRK
ncbi:MAG TPA: hypothetical protein VFQ67_11900 [Allosphingosinicella sp.]|jgi:hypothetical protein|nr:hypothetical protein [Allosphingosinicella sp.]